MASSICRSTSLTNLAVLEATITNVVEVKRNGSMFSELVYDVTVAWSDTREERIYRSYKEFQTINRSLTKLICQDKKIHRKRKINVPKIAPRKMFDFNLSSFMARNLKSATEFLRFLTHGLPPQLHRIPLVLNFFEKTVSDTELCTGLIPTNQLMMKTSQSCSPTRKLKRSSLNSNISSSSSSGNVNTYDDHDVTNDNNNTASPPQSSSCFNYDEYGALLWWDPEAIIPERPRHNDVMERENREIAEPYLTRKEFYLLTYFSETLESITSHCYVVT